MKIVNLAVWGFRSFRYITWSSTNLNVIIGPNRTGKSNLLRCLELISVSAQGKLGKYNQNPRSKGRGISPTTSRTLRGSTSFVQCPTDTVLSINQGEIPPQGAGNRPIVIQSLGGMEPIVWDGQAKSIKFVLQTCSTNGATEPDSYELELVRLGTGGSYKIETERLTNSHTQDQNKAPNQFTFLDRSASKAVIFNEKDETFVSPAGDVSDEESLLSIAAGPFGINHAVQAFQRELASFATYRDLDTRPEATIRQSAIARFEKRVDPDGQNLISVLHTLYTGDRDFKNDINAAMLAAFGDDFEELVFPPAADQRIQLRIRWKSLKREQSAAELSDGTLRFLFLLTVLASPSLAPMIAIDEPEIGLHPAMLPLIAEFAVEASKRAQIIFTTHSPQFLDAFTEDRPTTTVAKWVDGETTLHTLDDAQLDYWLKEYSLGSLFQSGELEQMA
ncbi:MAG: AAA family ATPase [Rhodoferax sp.]|nr:AAA family ATPase [Rhodoferax sp.]